MPYYDDIYENFFMERFLDVQNPRLPFRIAFLSNTRLATSRMGFHISSLLGTFLLRKEDGDSANRLLFWDLENAFQSKQNTLEYQLSKKNIKVPACRGEMSDYFSNFIARGKTEGFDKFLIKDYKIPFYMLLDSKNLPIGDRPYTLSVSEELLNKLSSDYKIILTAVPAMEYEHFWQKHKPESWLINNFDAFVLFIDNTLYDEYKESTKKTRINNMLKKLGIPNNKTLLVWYNHAGLPEKMLDWKPRFIKRFDNTEDLLLKDTQLLPRILYNYEKEDNIENLGIWRRDVMDMSTQVLNLGLPKTRTGIYLDLLYGRDTPIRKM